MILSIQTELYYARSLPIVDSILWRALSVNVNNMCVHVDRRSTDKTAGIIGRYADPELERKKRHKLTALALRTCQREPKTRAIQASLNKKRRQPLLVSAAAAARQHFVHLQCPVV